MLEKPEDWVLKWNYLFPVDRWWRKKYNIPLFSEEHLSQSQVSIALEYLEDKFFNSLEEKVRVNKEKEKAYKRGELVSSLEDTLTDEEKDDLFNKIDISAFNVKKESDVD